MKLLLVLAAIACFSPADNVVAFTSLQKSENALKWSQQDLTSVRSLHRSTKHFAATSAAPLASTDIAKEDTRSPVRREGGLFAFKTKYGALNPFAIFYGVMAILLGIPWFLGLTICQFLYKITGNRFDSQRRLPVFLSHAWGVTLMHLTRCYPVVENREILVSFYEEKRPAMFVANHNSWMDIPFLGSTIGWRNYKIVSKKELEKVPILGKAIRLGGNVMLDRTDRKSQIQTLKKGIDYLKTGVHLCTYPEGTRTRTGRLMPFKNGAFKMAYKAGAPIIPVSIVGASKVHPSHWMFPYRPAHGVARVIVHEPIESTGKTEEELAEEVRAAIIEGLPEDQRPLDE